SEAAVRESGAVPATVAVHDGRLLIRLGRASLEALANGRRGSVMKAARPSLSAAVAGGGWAATTVSATMIAAHAAGIRVFATGGIGGVHRGALGGAGLRGEGGRRRGSPWGRRRVDGDVRHLVRPRGVGPYSHRGRVCRSEGDPRRSGDTRIP